MRTRHLRLPIHNCTFYTRYFEKQRVQLHFVLENLVYQSILFQILISNAAPIYLLASFLGRLTDGMNFSVRSLIKSR